MINIWVYLREQKVPLGITLSSIMLLGWLITRKTIYSQTAWEWLKLILSPGIIAIGIAVTNEYLKTREKDKDLQKILKDYLDRMTQLMLSDFWPNAKEIKGEIDEDKQKRVLSLAQALTLTVLREIDGNRKGVVVRFLHESGALEVLSLKYADLSEANLVETDLSNSSLIKANLSGANLEKANLSGVDFSDANLSEANLSEVTLQDSQLLDPISFRKFLLKDRLTGENRIKVLLKGADLTNAKLNGATLRNVDLEGANLTKADLTNAVIRNSNLSNTKFVKTKFSNTQIQDSCFLGSNFRDIIIEEIDDTTIVASFNEISFRQSEFIDCRFNYCAFNQVDFSKTFFNKTLLRKCFVENVHFDESLFQSTWLEGNAISRSIFEKSIFRKASFLNFYSLLHCRFELCYFEFSKMDTSFFKESNTFIKSLFLFSKSMKKMDINLLAKDFKEASNSCTVLLIKKSDQDKNQSNLDKLAKELLSLEQQRCIISSEEEFRVYEGQMKEEDLFPPPIFEREFISHPTLEESEKYVKKIMGK